MHMLQKEREREKEPNRDGLQPTCDGLQPKRERERERRREHLQSLYDIQLLPTEGLVSFWARHQMDTINK